MRGIIAAVLLLTAVSVDAQTWTPPLTADGRPDLQGVWVSNGATPLERPKALEGKSVLTDDELRTLKERAHRLLEDPNGDFVPGDGLFLAALADLDRLKNPNATAGSDAMIDRVFENRTSLIVDPPDGRMPPQTEEGRRRRAAAEAARLRPDPDGPEDFTNDRRCLTFGTPRLGGPYGAGPYSYYQIVQTRDYVLLLAEFIHEARIIPLDGGPHLPSSLRQWNGDPRGRWEGNTLVVDTTNFSAKALFLGSTDNLHLVERFTRVAPGQIDYELTVDDPTTWARAWTARIPLRSTDKNLYEVACHEGDSSRHATLAGARAMKKQ